MASPLESFQRLEHQSLGNQITETEQTLVDTWRGFAFDVDGLNLTVPFEGQFEIVPGQALFPMPIAQSWVRGMTNIRGEIYTVVDFSEFIGKRPVRNAEGGNLLLLPDENLKSAFILESRISLRSFNTRLPTKNTSMFYAGISRFLSRVVIDGEKEWGVVDIDALSRSSEYVQIGV